jgi:hypothetical protein
MDEKLPPNSEVDRRTANAGVFGSILLICGAVSCGGVLVSGPIRSGYGAVSLGGIFALAAIPIGILAVLLAIFRYRDWRPWVTLVLCVLAFIAASFRGAPLGSGG